MRPPTARRRMSRSSRSTSSRLLQQERVEMEDQLQGLTLFPDDWLVEHTP